MTTEERSVSFYDEQLAIVDRDLAAHGKCPHCGWTPAEQDALSNEAREAARLRDLLQRFVKAWEGGGENMDRLCEIARKRTSPHRTGESDVSSADPKVQCIYRSGCPHGRCEDVGYCLASGGPVEAKPATPSSNEYIHPGMPEVEWLAILARDDKYATVQYCDVPIQDRRALIAVVKRLQDRITELHALGQSAANRADDAERSRDETPAPPEDVQMERLANYVGAYESLKTKSPKELVDLVLEHVIDLKPFHELLIEELCSRVHPGWEKDDSQVKTSSPRSIPVPDETLDRRKP